MVLTESTSLPLGWPAEDFELPDTEGKKRTLSEFINKKGLLITFTCNHCPYAQAAWSALIAIYKKYSDSIDCLAINPNDADNFPEDSYLNMQNKAKELNLPFPYLRDETQEIAMAYQAQCTPDLYLFKIDDRKPNLFYHGRINDNWKDSENVKEKNLESAINNLLNNEPPPENQPPSMGCSIKWLEI